MGTLTLLGLLVLGAWWYWDLSTYNSQSTNAPTGPPGPNQSDIAGGVTNIPAPVRIIGKSFSAAPPVAQRASALTTVLQIGQTAGKVLQTGSKVADVVGKIITQSQADELAQSYGTVAPITDEVGTADYLSGAVPDAATAAEAVAPASDALAAATEATLEGITAGTAFAAGGLILTAAAPGIENLLGMDAAADRAARVPSIVHTIRQEDKALPVVGTQFSQGQAAFLNLRMIATANDPDFPDAYGIWESLTQVYDGSSAFAQYAAESGITKAGIRFPNVAGIEPVENNAVQGAALGLAWLSDYLWVRGGQAPTGIPGPQTRADMFDSLRPWAGIPAWRLYDPDALWAAYLAQFSQSGAPPGVDPYGDLKAGQPGPDLIAFAEGIVGTGYDPPWSPAILGTLQAGTGVGSGLGYIPDGQDFARVWALLVTLNPALPGTPFGAMRASMPALPARPAGWKANVQRLLALIDQQSQALLASQAQAMIDWASQNPIISDASGGGGGGGA